MQKRIHSLHGLLGSILTHCSHLWSPLYLQSHSVIFSGTFHVPPFAVPSFILSSLPQPVELRWRWICTWWCWLQVTCGKKCAQDKASGMREGGVKCRGGGKQKLQENPQEGCVRWIFFSIMFLSPQWGLEGGIVSAGILWSSPD